MLTDPGKTNVDKALKTKVINTSTIPLKLLEFTTLAKYAVIRVPILLDLKTNINVEAKNKYTKTFPILSKL